MQNIFVQKVVAPCKENGNYILFTRSEGPYAYDVDGNQYIDYMNGKGSVLLGHNNSNLNCKLREFIHSQKSFRTGFSQLMYEVGEKILNDLNHNYIAFFKTGGLAIDATISSIKEYTNKKIILSSGYHGSGVIWKSSGELFMPNFFGIIDFFYNIFLLEKLIKKYKKEIACVVISMDRLHLTLEWYRQFNSIINSYNLLLVVDEVKTGYRFCSGLLSKRLGLKPDYAIVSKGIANGWPLAAVTSKYYCKPLENFTYTSFFDQLSFLAAKETLNIINQQYFYDKLEKFTTFLVDEFKKVINDHDFPIEIIHFGSMFQFLFNDQELEQTFYSYCLDEKMIFYPCDNQALSLAFEKTVIIITINRLNAVLEKIKHNYNQILKKSKITQENLVRSAWNIIDGLVNIDISWEQAKSYIQKYGNMETKSYE